MRKTTLASGEFYHVFNRGVDHRVIFESPEDFERFYHYLYLFNDSRYQNSSGDPLLNDALLAGHEVLSDARNPFVDIAAFCLRGNHYHLLLRQRVDGGIAAFLHRISMAYSKSFNRQRGRTGSLFEGAYQAVHVKNDAHILHLPRYIHLNALDLVHPEWREGKVESWDAAIRVLDSYPWSSHGYYCGRRQDLPVLSEEVVSDIVQHPEHYLAFLREWTARNLRPSILSLGDSWVTE